MTVDRDVWMIQIDFCPSGNSGSPEQETSMSFLFLIDGALVPSTTEFTQGIICPIRTEWVGNPAQAI